jgi:hypothetical protein
LTPKPKILDAWLLKLLVAPPVPVKIPFTVSSFVLPTAVAPPVPAPDPTALAVPNRLVALAIPPPMFDAVPPLFPVPTAVVPFSVPVVVLAILRAPLLAAKAPVGPVENGANVVTKVEGLKPPPVVPPLLGLPEEGAGMAEPGTSVTTALNCTGLKPAPKPPVPEEAVVPSNERVPIPPAVTATVPACEPVPPPAALPSAEPNTVSTKPDEPLVMANSPDPDPIPTQLATDPAPMAVPPPVAAPDAVPPLNCKYLARTGVPGHRPVNFLDPLRLGRGIVLLSENAYR